jgi:hypothetical protein
VTTSTADRLATLNDENRRLRALIDFSRQVTAERDLRAQLRLLCAAMHTTGCSAAAVILRNLEHGGIDAIETTGLPREVDAEWQRAVRACKGELAEALFSVLRRHRSETERCAFRVALSWAGTRQRCAIASRR